MRINRIKIVFIIVFIFHLLALQLGIQPWEQVSKALLVPLLAVLFLISVPDIKNKLVFFISAALFFSWAGDILLIFQSKHEMFFLGGLGAFLLAHLFYIFFFNSVLKIEKVRKRLYLLLPVAVYFVLLIVILFPYLAGLKIPVIIYGAFISLMCLLALHTWFVSGKGGFQMALGAVLFVVSDSILAFNKFYQPFALASLLIMITYGMAQLFITEGAADYIRRNNSSENKNH